MKPIQPARSGMTQMTATAVKELHRVRYNAATKSFSPLNSPSSSKKMEALEQLDERVATLNVPVDFSSPTLLKKIVTRAAFKAAPYKKPAPLAQPLPELPKPTNRF